MTGFIPTCAAAMCGGVFALIIPPLFEGGPVPFPCAVKKLRRAAAAWKRNGSAAPFLWVFIAVIALGGLCAHAGDALTIKLRRQQIPLHHSGGVIYHKSAYYGTIFVGQPMPQKFEVVFDTGSGHLVLPSTMCHSETCRAHRRYRRKVSKTAVDIDWDGTEVDPNDARDQITVSFGTGEVTGIFFEDLVCLGDQIERVQDSSEHGDSLLQTRASELHNKTTVSEDVDYAGLTGVHRRGAGEGCVRLRTVAATDMTHEPFSSFDFDGIMGLGLAGLSQTPEFNFHDSATKRGAWNTPATHTFSVFLATHEGEESDITFGGWVPDHIADDVPKEFEWADVQNPELGYWQVKVHAIRIGNRTLDYCKEGCRAVVDTGTSLLGVPSAVASEMRSSLQHQASPEGNCRSTEGPDLHIDLGSVTVTLTPNDYSRLQMPPEQDDPSVPVCMPMMMQIDLPEPLGPKLFILGEPVLQRYYTGFDSKAARVGFALAKHAPLPILGEDGMLPSELGVDDADDGVVV